MPLKLLDDMLLRLIVGSACYLYFASLHLLFLLFVKRVPTAIKWASRIANFFVGVILGALWGPLIPLKSAQFVAVILSVIGWLKFTEQLYVWVAAKQSLKPPPQSNGA